MSTSRTRAATAGALSAVAGMSVGHLIAGLLTPEASPVLAVASGVVDRTPAPLKEWAIRTFGSADKQVLLGSVAVVVLVLAALGGLLARRRFLLGAGMVVGMSGLALLAALDRPTADVASALPALGCAVVGCLVLAALLPITARRRGSPVATVSGALDSRRAFVLGSGAVAVGSVAAAAGGQRLVSAATSDVSLPAPARRLPTPPPGLQVKGISPFVTPQSRFYRVDTALVVPRVVASDWQLRIGGDVRSPFTLTLDELLDMPLVEKDITLTCVSNEVGGPYVGAGRWLGVPARRLLERAGVRRPDDPGMQVLSRSQDGMTISTPLTALLDDREALVAVGLNGTPLTPTHGFPARLVTPGLYGFVGATKWLTEMTVMPYAQQKAYWSTRGWSERGPIKPSARIDVPRSFAQLARNTRVVIGGVAWAQQQGVRGVQVSIDDGPWQAARLGPSLGEDYWRQWALQHTFTQPGSYGIRARVVYGDGRVQTEERADIRPDGSSGIQQVQVTVA